MPWRGPKPRRRSSRHFEWILAGKGCRRPTSSSLATGSPHARENVDERESAICPWYLSLGPSASELEVSILKTVENPAQTTGGLASHCHHRIIHRGLGTTDRRRTHPSSSFWRPQQASRQHQQQLVVLLRYALPPLNILLLLAESC